MACAGHTVVAQSVYPGAFDGKMKKRDVVEFRAKAFPLNDVKLLPSRFRDNLERDSAWMVSLPVASLVHSFQTTAGSWAGKEGGYMTVRKLGGWESLDCELRGHAIGHLTSAFALMYAATGENIFKQKGDSIITALKEVQAAHGTGYLSAYPERLIDRNLAGKSVWAPWYTLHKILSGLIDQYLYAENEDALKIAKGMGDWAYNKLQGIGEEQRAKMLRNEFGGINEAFYNLYAVTGNENYRWLARFFYHNGVMDPLKQGNADLGTLHTNTFIPKTLAEARNYELSGDEDSRRLTEFFYDIMLCDHTFVTGCSSDKEHYFPVKDFAKHLSGYTGETCCTYNMLKLARHLFCRTADESIADYYERALLNQILGQQDPQSGMVHYFQPMLSGSYKVYSTPWNSFWCCVGSGFENHAKYAEAVYYHNGDELFVNLFIPTVLLWKDKGISITQRTDFPKSETTSLTVSGNGKFTMKLRYPSWSGKAVVKVNGKKVATGKAGSYITIARNWKDGDKVEATFPMSVRAETAHGDASRVALLYGPVVLAGELGTEGMQSPAPFSDPKKYNDYYTYNYNIPAGLPTSLAIDLKNPARSLQKTGEPLVFKTAGGVTVSPLYDLHRQRYVVYWNNEK